MVIFPLAPDQTIAQMWSNGARGPGATNSDTVWYRPSRERRVSSWPGPKAGRDSLCLIVDTRRTLRSRNRWCLSTKRRSRRVSGFAGVNKTGWHAGATWQPTHPLQPSTHVKYSLGLYRISPPAQARIRHFFQIRRKSGSGKNPTGAR